MKYKETFILNHHERPAKINIESGEITEITKRPNNIPNNKERFEPKQIFRKAYVKAWDYLLIELNPIELKIVVQMSQMARMNSNSLSPLNNETSASKLAKEFSIDRRKVKAIFTHLFNIGVYAEFKFATTKGIKHYWVLNPYISFKGTLIEKSLVDLFRESPIRESVSA